MEKDRGTRICVITRTCNRPLFLDRAFDHIKSAAVPGIHWVVVNDFVGDNSTFENQIQRYSDECDWPISVVTSGQKHRAKALNAGLEKAHQLGCDYVHVLDDDDTISSDFYQHMSAFLDDAKNASYAAAACGAARVDEEMIDGGFKALKTRPHYPEQEAITFASLAFRMHVPICSVLFRARSLQNLKVDETFEVSEDYEFLLRFLRQGDIARIKRQMYCFHTRAGGEGDTSNSSMEHDFAVQNARFKNQLMRRDLENGTIGLGWLLTLAEMNEGNWRMNSVLSKAYKFSFLRRLYQLFRK